MAASASSPQHKKSGAILFSQRMKILAAVVVLLLGIAVLRKKPSSTDTNSNSSSKSQTKSNGARPPCVQLIGIGCMKGGTTMMHFHLAHTYRDYFHSSFIKELHFMDTYYGQYKTLNARSDAYLEKFGITDTPNTTTQFTKPCMSVAGIRYRPNNDKITVEATPIYLYLPHIPKRMKELSPDSKFLVMLRNPISRGISQLNMEIRKPVGRSKHATTDEQHLKRSVQALQSSTQVITKCIKEYGGEGVSYTAALQSCCKNNMFYCEVSGYKTQYLDTVWRGVYYEQLKNWFAIFRPENFLIWSSEEFYSDMPGHLHQLIDWLGVDKSAKKVALEQPKRDDLTSFQEYSVTADMMPDVIEELKEFYQPYNEQLVELLIENGFGKVAGQIKKHF